MRERKDKRFWEVSEGRTKKTVEVRAVYGANLRDAAIRSAKTLIEEQGGGFLTVHKAIPGEREHEERGHNCFCGPQILVFIEDDWRDATEAIRPGGKSLLDYFSTATNADEVDDAGAALAAIGYEWSRMERKAYNLAVKRTRADRRAERKAS